jgi:hypothetical protein
MPSPSKLIHYSDPPNYEKKQKKWQNLINLDNIEGLNGFRIKFKKILNIEPNKGNVINLKGALIYGEDVFRDINGDNC